MKQETFLKTGPVRRILKGDKKVIKQRNIGSIVGDNKGVMENANYAHKSMYVTKRSKPP